MKIKEILTTKKLPDSISARIDLELLLSAAINKPREFLYTNPEHQLSADKKKTFNELYQRRLQGEPIAYILGKKEFWKLELDINDKVLIPRPETELLVEILLKKVDVEKADVADLGTGSGAIVLSVAYEKPMWNVVATDISNDVLQVAKHNANKFKLHNVDFYCGNWCDALPLRKFDAIVSNPPYISENDPHLLQGDVRFEPKTALESGDGLADIKLIVEQAKSRLKSGGMLVIEHGYNQSEGAQKILHSYGYEEIESYKDLAGVARIVTARV